MAKLSIIFCIVTIFVILICQDVSAGRIVRAADEPSLSVDKLMGTIQGYFSEDNLAAYRSKAEEIGGQLVFSVKDLSEKANDAIKKL